MAITVQYPTVNTVCQRDDTHGDIPIQAVITGATGPFTLEAHLGDNVWQTIASGLGNVIDVRFNVPVGQYALTLRIAETSDTVTINPVSVGDVFVITGQSNALTPTSTVNVYAEPTNHPTWVTSGFIHPTGWINHRTHNYYRRNCFPYIAQAIIENHSVPIGFVQCAEPSTSIAQHLPDTALFERMVLRVTNATKGRVRGVLLHIGESDTLAYTSRNVMRNRLLAFADAVHAHFDTDVYACKIQQVIPRTASWHEVNAAIEDGPYFHVAADLRHLIPDDNRAHLTKNPNLQDAAALWYAGLNTLIYS